MLIRFPGSSSCRPLVNGCPETVCLPVSIWNVDGLHFSPLQQKFGMSKAVLGGVVKRLQAQGTFFSSRLPSGRLPFESRLEVVLDRFDHIDLKQGERKELKELAKE